jgi:hypothetical protein
MTTKAQLTPQVDVTVANEGSLFTFALETERARQWVAEHVVGETLYFGGNTLIVEHRYAADLARGMINDGLNIQ